MTPHLDTTLSAGEGGKERPIIFSAPMVRAILAGRKAQTRRIVKRPTDHFHASYTHLHQEGERFVWSDGRGGCQRAARMPAQAGDRLWVRETWQVARETTDYETGGEYDVFEWDEEIYGDPREHLNGSSRFGIRAGLFYRADGEDENPSVFYPLTGLNDEVLRPAEIKWRSPIFMPRWASRLTLEVTEVRVERLQDISEADAVAEGICPCGGMWSVSPDDIEASAPTARWAYQKLWCRLHGPASYEANPWVAAISFRVLPSSDTLNAEGVRAPSFGSLASKEG